MMNLNHPFSDPGLASPDAPDDYFECVEGHVHDKTNLTGPLHEGAPCPNDPESPNAYPEVSDDT